MGTASRIRILALTLLVLVSGCTVLDVDMTSTPDVVRRGQPVTFDITLTNRSSCPLKTSAALLIAFIPAENFLFEVLGVSRENVPPELAELIDLLEMFFDELCSGGEPIPPDLASAATSCVRSGGDVLCQMSMPLPAHEGSTGSSTFAGLGDRLQCEVDDGTVRCQLRIPLPQGAETAHATSRAAAVEPLSCIPADQVGELPFGDADAVCFVGSLSTNIEGLGPNGVGNGQIALPARGAGRVRNIVIAIADSDDELGVCKGGTNPGDACAMDDPTDCQDGGSCAEGICEGGANNGRGCDTGSAVMDCGAGITCQPCSDLAQDSFLPIDCTETIISAEPVPVMSPRLLAGLAVVLLLFGSFWLHRSAVTRRLHG